MISKSGLALKPVIAAKVNIIEKRPGRRSESDWWFKWIRNEIDQDHDQNTSDWNGFNLLKIAHIELRRPLSRLYSVSN